MFKVLMAVLVAIPAVVFAADAPRTVSPGSLSWGTTATFAPFEFQKDGETVGFDVDLMAELARRVGLQSAVLGDGFRGHRAGGGGAPDRCGGERMYITRRGRRCWTSFRTC